MCALLMGVGQAMAWTSAGPWGGVIHDLKNAPAGANTLYAATANGIYVYDGVLPWSQYHQTKGYRVLQMVPDPARDVLYAVAQQSTSFFDPEGLDRTGTLYSLDLTGPLSSADFSPMMGTEVAAIAVCGSGDLLAAANEAGVGYVYRFSAGGGSSVKISPGDLMGASWPISAIQTAAGSSTVYVLRNSSNWADVLISENNAACGTTWFRDGSSLDRTSDLAGGKLLSLGIYASGEVLAGTDNGLVLARNSGAWAVSWNISVPNATLSYPVVDFATDGSQHTFAVLRRYGWDTSQADETPGGLFRLYDGGVWVRWWVFDNVTSRVRTLLTADGYDWISFDDVGIWRVPAGLTTPLQEADEGIAAVDLEGMVIDPRHPDRALAYGLSGLYERRSGDWRRLVMETFTNLAGDQEQVVRERGFLSAAFSYDDQDVIWAGGNTTGLLRGVRASPGSWDYSWEYVFGGTLGKSTINDIVVDPFDSRCLWWATGGAAYMSSDEALTNLQITENVNIRDIDFDLLEPRYRTFLAGLQNGSSSASGLMAGDGVSQFQDTSLYPGGSVDSLVFNPLELGNSQRALVGHYGSLMDREMAVIQDQSGAWEFDSQVAIPSGLPSAIHHRSLQMPLGYDGDEHPDAFTAVEQEGTGIHSIYHSIAGTVDGSPGEAWVDVTGELAVLEPSCLITDPKDGNLLWVTTHLGSAYTMQGSHVTDNIPPAFTLAARLEVPNAADVYSGASNTIELTWPAPGDDGNMPGWADRYELYYRSDRAITGTTDLVGATLVNLPAPHIANRQETCSLDISARSDTVYSLALLAFDEQNQPSPMITAAIGALSATVSTPPSPTASGGGGCFIATAAYGSPLEQEVDLLRGYRDRYLIHRAWGRLLLKAYYALSPGPAEYISNKPALRGAVRIALTPVISAAKGRAQGSALPVAVGFGVVLMPLGIAGWGSFFLIRRIKRGKHAKGRRF